MTTHTIEIQGLPEGWEPVALKVSCNVGNDSDKMTCGAMLTLQKTKPPRIVLEETEEDAETTHFINAGDVFLHIESGKIWRIKAE